MTDTKGRRPLKTRNADIAKRIAKWLSDKNISPNQISIASIVFALLAAICLLRIPYATGSLIWILPLLAVVSIQLRLACNLFDGMVAIEGGKSTAAGELFNDIPDRIADPLIIVSAGYAITITPWGVDLGWLAGLLAIMTAYVRYVGASVGAPINFMGPMAKPHRMALLTGAGVLSAIAGIFSYQGGNYIFLIALIVMIIGCSITLFRRTKAIYTFLESK